MTGCFILEVTAWFSRVRNSDAVVARVERFLFFLLERCWYKGAWSKQWHLGLMPSEWAKVNGPVHGFMDTKRVIE